MKKFILIFAFFLLGGSLIWNAVLAQTKYQWDEVVVDYECQASKLFSTSPTATTDNYDNCSVRCHRACLYKPPNYDVRKAGGYCIEDKKATPPYACLTLGEDPDIFSDLNKVNFLGIEIDRAPLILVRRVMLGVFGAAGLIILGFGMIGMYKFAFSQGSQEKVQEAIKIFRSLIIGSVIVFAGLALIQIVATVSGVTGSLFDFNFMPRTGRFVYLYPDDLGKKCLVEQVALPDGEQYKCNKTTLVWVE